MLFDPVEIQFNHQIFQRLKVECVVNLLQGRNVFRVAADQQDDFIYLDKFQKFYMVLKGEVNIGVAFVKVKDKYGISDYRMVQELAG